MFHAFSMVFSLFSHFSFPSCEDMPRDADFTIDFEEFVIFLHVLNKTAEGFQMSFGELLFPGIVKKEVPEGQEEEVQKPQEELSNHQLWCSLGIKGNN